MSPRLKLTKLKKLQKLPRSKLKKLPWKKLSKKLSSNKPVRQSPPFWKPNKSNKSRKWPLSLPNNWRFRLSNWPIRLRKQTPATPPWTDLTHSRKSPSRKNHWLVIKFLPLNWLTTRSRTWSRRPRNPWSPSRKPFSLQGKRRKMSRSRPRQKLRKPQELLQKQRLPRNKSLEPLWRLKS